MDSQNKAVKIAEKVFKKLKLEPGVSEKEVARWIRKELKLQGARKEAFRIIVASGRRSAKPHGFASTKRLRPGEIVMVDFGALFKGFRSDITRTYVLGKPTIKQKRIYRILKTAQRAAIRKIKEGIGGQQVDNAARSVIEKAGYGKNFIHSTGHGVGRKVHEPPKLSRKSKSYLKAGQVVTVEPGIYIKGWGGMRIEDMVLVTKRGCRLLTRVPK